MTYEYKDVILLPVLCTCCLLAAALLKLCPSVPDFLKVLYMCN